MSEREVIRCSHCDLNQFMTRNQHCRRCTKPLVELVEENLVEVPTLEREVRPLPCYGRAIDEAFRTAVWLVRQGLGMSQGDMARAMNCQRTYISKFENGYRDPWAKNVHRYADALGMSQFSLMSIVQEIFKGMQHSQEALNV